jgi:hypothetical protein
MIKLMKVAPGSINIPTQGERPRCRASTVKHRHPFHIKEWPEIFGIAGKNVQH